MSQNNPSEGEETASYYSEEEVPTMTIEQQEDDSERERAIESILSESEMLEGK